MALGVVTAVNLNSVNELGVTQLVDVHVGSYGVKINLKVASIKFVDGRDGREVYGSEVPDSNRLIANRDTQNTLLVITNCGSPIARAIAKMNFCRV